MKNTLKFSLSLIVLLFASTLFAQEYKCPVKANTTLVLEKLFSNIVIEGYDGKELIVTSKNIVKPPKRAEGLRSLYNTQKDNTGIGLVMKNLDGKLTLSAASKQAAQTKYVFKIPKNMSVEIDNSSPFSGNIKISNCSGELAVNTLSGDISLANVNGPVVISSVSGNITIDFSALSQKAPSSIKSISGDVDVSLPEKTKVNLRLSNIHGDAFTDFDVKFKNETDEMERIGGGTNFDGSINGGGVTLDLGSISSNVYLRKK
jgi:putative adhesin